MAVLRINVLIVSLALAVGFWTSGCSDDPFCGDGELNASDEECDDGNSDDSDFCLSTCKARVLSRLFVKWEFNSDPERGFSGDSCIEMGASKVEVTLTGGPEPIEPLTESCSSFQAAFVDIPPGNYTIELRVLDRDDVSILNGPVSESFAFAGGNSTAVVVIPPNAWANDYLGDFFFRLSWGGEDCPNAVPPVVEQTLSLVVDGLLVSSSTEAGTLLDGSAPAMCVPTDEERPQTALDVPFGLASLKVQGHDSEGVLVYEEIFDTFVGAGGNPTLVFDVDLLPL